MPRAESPHRSQGACLHLLGRASPADGDAALHAGAGIHKDVAGCLPDGHDSGVAGPHGCELLESLLQGHGSAVEHEGQGCRRGSAHACTIVHCQVA